MWSFAGSALAVLALSITAAAAETIKVATWNMNNLRAGTELKPGGKV